MTLSGQARSRSCIIMPSHLYRSQNPKYLTEIEPPLDLNFPLFSREQLGLSNEPTAKDPAPASAPARGDGPPPAKKARFSNSASGKARCTEPGGQPAAQRGFSSASGRGNPSPSTGDGSGRTTARPAASSARPTAPRSSTSGFRAGAAPFRNDYPESWNTAAPSGSGSGRR